MDVLNADYKGLFVVFILLLSNKMSRIRVNSVSICFNIIGNTQDFSIVRHYITGE